jgi:hypothetical protein
MNTISPSEPATYERVIVEIQPSDECRLKRAFVGRYLLKQYTTWPGACFDVLETEKHRLVVLTSTDEGEYPRFMRYFDDFTALVAKGGYPGSLTSAVAVELGVDYAHALNI